MTGCGVPKGGGQVAGGGGGIPRHYGPWGRSGLQLPILLRGRPPCRGRGLRQDHQLERAVQGGPGAHLGALLTAPRRGPAVRCRSVYAACLMLMA